MFGTVAPATENRPNIVAKGAHIDVMTQRGVTMGAAKRENDFAVVPRAVNVIAQSGNQRPSDVGAFDPDCHKNFVGMGDEGSAPSSVNWPSLFLAAGLIFGVVLMMKSKRA
jgi:hypothetical protein